MIVLLDTNVLLRWGNPADTQHGLAVRTLSMLRSSGHTPAVVPQVLYEFWVVATRPKRVNGLGLSVAKAAIEIDRLSGPLFGLLSDDSAALPVWLELVTRYEVQGKPAHDARLVAAMVHHGVTHLVTFNTSDFARYSEIEVHSPEEVAAGKHLG